MNFDKNIALVFIENNGQNNEKIYLKAKIHKTYIKKLNNKKRYKSKQF